MDRPIPSFYCVYLLRSKRSPQTLLYIGSTPNPRRRLRQHNGGSQGGAKKTRKPLQRPWKMCMIVSNFPSKIAALQFEWAWQHPYRTRHIADEDRGGPASKKHFSAKKAGPFMPFLHALLRHKTFSRWPLSMKFFAEDAYKEWQNYVDSHSQPVPPWITAKLMSNDARLVPKMRKSKKNPNPELLEEEVVEDEPQPSVDALDVTYRPRKRQLESSMSILKRGKCTCSICRRSLDQEVERILLCSHDGCDMTSHLDCLASRFTGTDSPNLIPTTGSCPKCCGRLLWSDVVRDLSLRMRGQAHIKKLLRRQRGGAADAEAEQELSAESEPEDEDDPSFPDIEGGEAFDVPKGTENEQSTGPKATKLSSLPLAAALTCGTDTSHRDAVANSDLDDIEAYSE